MNESVHAVVVIIILASNPCFKATMLHAHRMAKDVCTTENGGFGTCTKMRRCPTTYFFSPHCRRNRICCLRQMPDVHVPDHYYPMMPHAVEDERHYYNDRRYFITTTTTTTTTTSSPLGGMRTAVDEQIPNLRVRGCGIKEINMTDYIVGGRESEYWPWTAAIFYMPRDARTGRFQCGGTVISQRYILTAAHCLQDGGVIIPRNRLAVRMGGPTQNGDGQLYLVASVTLHEDYRSNIRYNDIALLRLSTDIQSKKVVPACLPSPTMYSANFVQRNATVLGWGRTSDGGSFSNTLRETIVPVVSRNRCNANYQRLNSLSLPRGIAETQLCAGTNDGTRDACQGDSGGPLILEDRFYKWTIVGIVSFGYGCAHPDYPGVYTRVSKYLSWIRDNTDIPVRSR